MAYEHLVLGNCQAFTGRSELLLRLPLDFLLVAGGDV